MRLATAMDWKRSNCDPVGLLTRSYLLKGIGKERGRGLSSSGPFESTVGSHRLCYPDATLCLCVVVIEMVPAGLFSLERLGC